MAAHYPRFAAWVVLLALIGIVTFGGVLGLRTLEPALPANLSHVHGVVVAVENNGTFAVQTPEYNSPLWFRIVPGAPISLDHLRRHMHERAGTDVYYQKNTQQHKMFPAWEAD
jgi:hypothetical protein